MSQLDIYRGILKYLGSDLADIVVEYTKPLLWEMFPYFPHFKHHAFDRTFNSIEEFFVYCRNDIIQFSDSNTLFAWRQGAGGYDQDLIALYVQSRTLIGNNYPIDQSAIFIKVNKLDHDRIYRFLKYIKAKPIINCDW